MMVTNSTKINFSQSPQSNSIQSLKIGILDVGLITPGKTAVNVIKETLASASLADSLGYSRYWLTEHHEPCFAWASPEIILTLIAQLTDRIRIGTAGILLYFYSPLKIAEIARLLEVLYPQRLDLGITSGIADKETIEALTNDFNLQQALKENIYGEKVNKLFNFLTNNFPPNHHFAAGATPSISTVPEIWLLGTGRGDNLRLAAAQGTAFSYSLYHACSKCDRHVVQEYRQQFCPSSILSEPKCNLAVSIICAETETEAKQQQNLVENIDKTSRVNVVGTPEQCKEQLLELQYQYQVSEIMLLVSWHIVEQRHYSQQMLAEVLNLQDSEQIIPTDN